ncbi:type II toxin-antitoxin system HicA family toxin [Candidatus Woesearchaeota archaeon]|nr:type II toxin-antitoxin system HicA family toxin [Candidatus Woesearchaeota archaeon]
MKLPVLSSGELCRFLEKEGFLCIRQRGSHRYYRHPGGRCTVVPIHTNRDIGRGLLREVLNEIGMQREEFLERLRQH